MNRPEATTDQKISSTNSLDFSKRCAPTITPCGNFLAYIIKTTDDHFKIVVRTITNRNYNVVLQKNLTFLLRLSADKNSKLKASASKQNCLENFMDKYDLKSTFKANNDYLGVLNNDDFNNMSGYSIKGIRGSDVSNKYIIRWACIGSRKVCNKLAVLDSASNVFYIFDIFNENLNITVNSGNENMRMVGLCWFNDSIITDGNNHDIVSHLGVFFEDNLSFKIFEVSNNNCRFMYEVSKPKFDKLLHRYPRHDGLRNSSMMSLVQADNGNDIIHSFDILMGKYQKQIIPFSKFTLPYNVSDIKWSPVGKWLCYLSNNMQLSLLNSLGLGKIENSHHKDSGCCILQKDLTDFGIYSISFMDWSFVESSLIFPNPFKAVDNNYPILSSISEILLLGDYEGNLHIFSSMPCIDRMAILQHRKKVNINEESNILIQDNNGTFQKIDGVLYDVPCNEYINSFDTIYKIRFEINSKFKDLFNHQEQGFSTDYFQHCITKNNLLAVMMRKSKNVIYFWNLNDIFHAAKYQDEVNSYSSYDLIGILQTYSDILDFSWHPIFSNYLLIVTKSNVIIWNPTSQIEPLVIFPNFGLTKNKWSQSINKSENPSHKDFISDAKWISPRSDVSEFIASFSLEAAKKFFKIYCETKHGQFVIIEVPLNNDHIDSLKSFNKEFVELFSSSDENLYNFKDLLHHPEEKHNDRNLSHILLDDDTKAMGIYKTVQVEDWLSESYNNNSKKRIQDLEDTFGYKKKKIFSGV